jgi:hypothetical protein
MNWQKTLDYSLTPTAIASAFVAGGSYGQNMAGVSATPVQLAGAIGLPAILSLVLAIWQWWRNRKAPVSELQSFADIEAAYKGLCDKVKAERARIEAEEKRMRNTQAVISGKTVESQP